jgi:hypothetical protein
MQLSTIFEYFCDCQFFGEDNWSNRRKPTTCYKSMTNLTCSCFWIYITLGKISKLTSLEVIGSDYTDRQDQLPHEPNEPTLDRKHLHVTCMEGSVLNFLKVEWKVSDTGSVGSAHWASSFMIKLQFTIFLLKLTFKYCKGLSCPRSVEWWLCTLLYFSQRKLRTQKYHSFLPRLLPNKLYS